MSPRRSSASRSPTRTGSAATSSASTAPSSSRDDRHGRLTANAGRSRLNAVRPGRVIIVGSVNIDLVIAADRLPRPGETVTGGIFAQHHGGKGGNQAVAAARVGASTVMVGAVGDDDFGI